MSSLWTRSVTFSFVLHLAFLFSFPSIINKKEIDKAKKKETKLEVIEEKKIKPLKSFRKTDITKPKMNNLAPPYLKNLVRNAVIGKNKTAVLKRPRILDKKLKDAILAQLPKEKELKKNPAYMDYYQIIRERIRINAFKYYESIKTGEIYLTFIINNDGSLDGLYLDSNLSNHDELTDIALKSVEAAAPFPSFPKELVYSKLQFKISILFKNN